MAKDEHMLACGMHTCGKCSKITFVFGILFLIAGLGLWTGAPAWFNGWMLVGLFLFVWGLASMMKM